MEAKLEKVLETEVAATLALAVATRMGSTPAPDPQKADPKTLALCMETWNVFQDFQAGEYAGIESNSGKIWSDPVAGISAAANAASGGANPALAGSIGQLVDLGSKLLAGLQGVPGVPATVATLATQFGGVLTTLVGQLPGGQVPPVTPPVTPPVAKTLTPTA